MAGAAGADEDEDTGWQIVVNEGTSCCCWVEGLLMGPELMTVTAAGRPVPQTGPGVLLEGDSDRAPMVCPIMVVLPDNWIWTPGAIEKKAKLNNIRC